MPNRAAIEEKIAAKRERLKSYYAREKEMLEGGGKENKEKAGMEWGKIKNMAEYGRIFGETRYL